MILEELGFYTDIGTHVFHGRSVAFCHASCEVSADCSCVLVQPAVRQTPTGVETIIQDTPSEGPHKQSINSQPKARTANRLSTPDKEGVCAAKSKKQKANKDILRGTAFYFTYYVPGMRAAESVGSSERQTGRDRYTIHCCRWFCSTTHIARVALLKKQHRAILQAKYCSKAVKARSIGWGLS